MKTKMMKTLAGVAALSLSAAALAPAAASAQPWRGGYDQGERFTGRYDALEWQLRQAADQGRIPHRQADVLLRQWRVNQPLAWRVETGRASPRERDRVLRTMDRIETALDHSERYSRYDDRYDRWRR
ncbi:hypothetical protein [Phenylobacterium sp. J367]|uniref:hypothetical protein n=1 Tax=Phenylobacterium sp. J367 TaxID=2898435 RepID=UPI0021513F9C|nr:hypothetical protein [Phenylobacterium sp. J367]MCR5879808.1 hypothetical protein [Phenylobacterium sp. J367]